MRRGLGLTPRDSAAAKARGKGEGRPAGERFLSFEVAGQMVAIPLAFIREVVPADGLTPDRGVLGEEFASFVYRGSPIPAIRVGLFFGYREAVPQGGGRLVVGEAGGRRFGLLVEGVAGVAEVPVQDILPLPDGATGLPAACFRGVWARGDRAVLLLDEKGLAALEGLERIGEAREAPAPLEGSGVA